MSLSFLLSSLVVVYTVIGVYVPYGAIVVFGIVVAAYVRADVVNTTWCCPYIRCCVC